MFNVLGQINWVAMTIATIVTAALGAVWFTVLFGRIYITALGRNGQPAFKMTPIFMVGPFVCGLVTCIAAAVLIRALDIVTYRDALVFGLVIGAGFLGATTINTGINPNIPRPLLYGAVSGSYFTVVGVIMSLILVALS